MVRGRKHIAGIVTVAAVVVGLGGPATAEPAATQSFRIVYAGAFPVATGPDGRSVVTNGAVNSVGYESLVTQGPGPSPGTFVGTSQFTFPDGSYSVTISGVVEGVNVFGPGDCFRKVDVSGTYELVGESGAFAGMTGTGTVSGHNTVLATPTDGGCSAEGAMLVSNLEGSGPVTSSALAAA